MHPRRVGTAFTEEVERLFGRIQIPHISVSLFLNTPHVDYLQRQLCEREPKPVLDNNAAFQEHLSQSNANV